MFRSWPIFWSFFIVVPYSTILGAQLVSTTLNQLNYICGSIINDPLQLKVVGNALKSHHKYERSSSVLVNYDTYVNWS